jgi:Aldehyde dehydrogenase family
MWLIGFTARGVRSNVVTCRMTGTPLYDRTGGFGDQIAEPLGTDREHAMDQVAGALKCGYVWINGAGQYFPGMPCVGWKAFGIGREGGLEELLDYSQEKAINVML